ncbi:MAG: glycosyltransferase [Staphylococcus sp.]|nr:glycosyltransferase [Staphylococcus sp.]
MKPRVLIVNKFYYPRGGDCVCAINLERLLAAQGFGTAVFSMDYSENIPSEWSRHFAPEVDFSGPVSGKLAAVRRVFGLDDVRSRFAAVLDEFRPDIVHFHNIHSYLSPILVVMAHERGLRVVWTLHDYKLICPSYSCLTPDGVCEDCVGGSPFAVVRRRCMKGSLAASVIGWLEALRWNRHVLERNVDAFICPSEFMKRMMMKAGYSDGKLLVNCNFIDPDRLGAAAAGEVPAAAEPYYCYVGRLSAEKGVDFLLEVASGLPYKIKVAGGGPMAEELAAKYATASNIEFLGPLSGEQVGSLLKGAMFSVVPSVWYENNPLSVIESLSLGTPVVGADIGGIPELIVSGRDGLIFDCGDREDLRESLLKACTADWNREMIKDNALRRFSSANHFSRLEAAYGLR